MFCKTCGNQLNSGDNHCSKCGTPVVVNNNESVVNNTNNNVSNSSNVNYGMNNNISNNVSQTINNKKGSSFIKIYLMMFGGAVACFFIFTIISLVMRMGSADPENYTSPAILNFFQITIPILLIMFGWIPALLLSSKGSQNSNVYVNQNNNYNPNIVPKKRTGLKIVLFVIGGFVFLLFAIGAFTVITSKKYECKSSQGNITIMYKDGKITGHTAKNMEFDKDAADDFVEQYGIEEYFTYLKQVFEAQTDGTCEYK